MRSLLDILKEVLEKLKALTTSTNKKTEINLLWTNPNPTSSFAAQTVNVNLSGCDLVAIEYLITSAVQYRVSTIATLAAEKTLIIGSSVYGSNSKIVGYYRGANVYSTYIVFNKGWCSIPSSDTEDNSCMIPLKIYGIKLGGS